MEAQTYIENRLKNLLEPSKVLDGLLDLPAEEKIKRLILSKKFRKYSANPELIEKIEKAIKIQMENNEPINITFLNGAYKLWRLEESPGVDWAELFSIMYYTSWVKPICEIYEPGVHFDFFMDDHIITRLNNVPHSDVETYMETFTQLLNFVSDYFPKNLNMTLTPVGSLFESEEAFDELLQQNRESLLNQSDGHYPDITNEQKAVVELNVKVTPEQEKDPDWQKKVWLLHNAYGPTKKSPNYHYRDDKILAFTQPLPSGTTVSVGTTKTSIAKFWVGVGALKKRKEAFIETILSVKQLENTPTETSKVSIKGLEGKNFQSIRIV